MSGIRASAEALLEQIAENTGEQATIGQVSQGGAGSEAWLVTDAALSPSSAGGDGSTTAPASGGAGTALANHPCKSVIVQLDPSETGKTIQVGLSNDPKFVLAAGSGVALTVSNTNLVYIRSTDSSTPTVNFIYRN